MASKAALPVIRSSDAHSFSRLRSGPRHLSLTFFSISAGATLPIIASLLAAGCVGAVAAAVPGIIVGFPSAPANQTDR